MSTAYQPFPIMEFKTGTNTYLQPWIRPADAFEPLTNAYVYRGIISKRAGYSQFGNTLDDDNPVMGIMQWIDQATGDIFLVVASTQNLYEYNPGTDEFDLLTSGLQADLFTGNITNFFNWTNWQPTSSSDSLLYMVNGKDPITTFDGSTTVDQPTLTVDGAGQTITTAIDVRVYKNRLLAIRPTLSSDGAQNQSIYWSATNNPTNFLNTTTGNGGFLAAPTGDIIQSAEFVRDLLVVFFTNSTWIFRYTGNDFAPFRWDKANTSKSTNAPYASIQYDERVTSIGKTGLIACDGVNVQRYDLPIIDYYETNFWQTYIAQAFSQRYDNLNQTWTLYVSSQNEFPVVDDIAPGSDQALVYNFLENTWATYDFNIPLTCMGTFFTQSDVTWAALTDSWEDTDVAWNSYYVEGDFPILLAGDTTGHVWYMDNGRQITDKEIEIIEDEEVTIDLPIDLNILSTRWNPVVIQGQKVQFGYIDIYYYVASLDPDNAISVTLDFYVDNSDIVAATRTLTLDGKTGTEYTFKRIYVNLIGQFIQMRIDPDVNSLMQFTGFILWVRPAGRFTGP